ncbi:MAG: DEAD/DEAH box helicase, partial [Actinobacteria bacterium]|nr:DEAD/DEAH box helicase [Actinomycetota bacterium]
MRWRRTTRSASWSPLWVRAIFCPRMLTRPSDSMRLIISDTDGRETPRRSTRRAWISCIDHLVSDPLPPNIQRTRVLYISPLRALAFDVEKNLRAPIVGIQHAAERLGEMFVEPTVGIRTGDTSSKERKQLVRNPPDILITTPESLFLMLTSAARETLANVDTVIIDEIHALAPTKRGAHLMVSLERLEEITAKPFQRIGLSATQRPL